MSKSEVDTQIDVSKSKTEQQHTKVTPKGQVKSDEKTDLSSLMIPRDLMLYLYVFSLALGTFQTGWAIFGNTQTALVFIKKFGWDSQQAKLYTTLFSNSSIVGLFLGSLVGVKSSHSAVGERF